VTPAPPTVKRVPAVSRPLYAGRRCLGTYHDQSCRGAPAVPCRGADGPESGVSRRVATCLDSETVRRLAECFASHVCRRCGHAAERLAGGRFYCGRHFPRDRAAAGEPAKVYKYRGG
jgi:hypothetical protein